MLNAGLLSCCKTNASINVTSLIFINSTKAEIHSFNSFPNKLAFSSIVQSSISANTGSVIGCIHPHSALIQGKIVSQLELELVISIAHRSWQT